MTKNTPKPLHVVTGGRDQLIRRVLGALATGDDQAVREGIKTLERRGRLRPLENVPSPQGGTLDHSEEI